jgi:hypothetical protein
LLLYISAFYLFSNTLVPKLTVLLIRSAGGLWLGSGLSAALIDFSAHEIFDSCYF